MDVGPWAASVGMGPAFCGDFSQRPAVVALVGTAALLGDQPCLRPFADGGLDWSVSFGKWLGRVRHHLAFVGAPAAVDVGLAVRSALCHCVCAAGQGMDCESPTSSGD